MKSFRTALTCCICGLLATASLATAQAAGGAEVQVRVDATKGLLPISPYLFGKNNGVSDLAPQFVKDVGLRITRDSNGNNCTKYNWREDVSSHPDWYNNVYPQQLQERAAKLGKNYGDLQVLYGLQVLGWVAKADGAKFNFLKNDNKPPGTPIEPPGNNNLCANGDTTKYLEPWTPKDTVDMLDHWFKPGGLGLDPGHFKYIHLDNEPECWSSTHDDISPKPMTAEQCVQKYVAVAKEVRKRYPNIKIMAPGFTSEWFWWNWSDGKAVGNMPWAQYFIKRMAEESKAFGKPLLDVIDYHTYMDGKITDAELLQQHRVLYDEKYQSPQANGAKRFPDGGWHDEQHVEDIFGRTEQWRDEYFGKNSHITLGITECDPGKREPMVDALWYASMLGTFADHGVEVYCPWGWYDSWWEVLHVFSRYGQANRVESVSSDETMVSAYSSISDDRKALTVILLNREKSAVRNVRLAIAGIAPEGSIKTYTLANLPDGATFKSHADNALKQASATTDRGVVKMVLPAYSITAVVFQTK